MLPIVWLVLGIVTCVAASRSAKSSGALRLGRLTVGVLYVGAGALVNAVFLATGEDYGDFAEGSDLAFVRDTWRSLVVPNHDLFISLLIAFELAVGTLVLSGGRKAELGLAGAIAFHVGLVAFGWGFHLWSVPMLVALALLLRAQRLSRSPHPSQLGNDGDRPRPERPHPPRDRPLLDPAGRAGAHVVRISGRIYETLLALGQRRPRCPLFHSH